MKKSKFIFQFLIFIFFAFRAYSQEIFIKITSPGNIIEGESLVKGHEKEIIAVNFGQEASGCDNTIAGGGGGTCKVTTSSFAFDMKISKALIGLKKSLYKGTHIAKVEITFRRPGANPFEYYKILLADVLVSKITDATDGTSNINQVQFSAAKFFWSYYAQDVNGAPLPAVTFGWNMQTQTEWDGVQ